MVREELDRLFEMTRLAAAGMLESRYDEELESLTVKLEAVIDEVEDPIIADMIRERYLKNRKWFQIAAKWAVTPDAARKSCMRAIAAVPDHAVSRPGERKEGRDAEHTAGAQKTALRTRPSCGRCGAAAVEEPQRRPRAAGRPAMSAPSSAEYRTEYARAYKAADQREQSRSEGDAAAEIKRRRSRGGTADKAHGKRVYKHFRACRLCRKERARKAARRRAQKCAHRCDLFVKNAEIYKGGAYH